jgi:hypothetical protein
MKAAGLGNGLPSTHAACQSTLVRAKNLDNQGFSPNSNVAPDAFRA